uniref:Bromodomain adjacent to zinc finger domain, 2A n=1 Tax=Cyclopterus lumpus TaxID=8103 RepID=A0A8C3G0X9_CYCLU
MESNNHFNYDTHSSANSGLKLSSVDSLYTNGSSMSFPQQGKSMNGEMNVNGVTTVLGSGVPGSHPPTAPYPHMSNHHQSSMGYDYLWGGHPQYSPAMGNSPGHGMHQKQPTPGMVQPQSQHHFQGHGQYQLNGGVESSHQPPVAGPPNMPLTGSQYWNRSNPGPQQISYNSHSMYGTYPSQAHPGITPSQHHQQQSIQPTPHQPSQQHLHSHRLPHHHHQQHQQPQHYGLMPNGMPYYQHQPQHPSLPSPQQQPSQQSQPQGQAQMMPPAAQNFSPSHGSPQHHSLSGGGTGSPLPVGISSTPMMSPSTVQDSGSPKGHSRERSPHASNVGISTASTPPRVSELPTVAPGPPLVSPTDVESTPPQISTPPNVSPAAPPRLSSSPLMKQGLRPPAFAATETSPAGTKHLSVGSSSSSLPTSPQTLSTPHASTDSMSTPAASLVSPQSSHSLTHQIKSSSPPSASRPQSNVTTAPISSLQQMFLGSKPPLMTSCFPDTSGAQHQRPGPPKLLSAASSMGAKSSSAGVAPPLMSASGSSTSTPPSSCTSLSVSKTPSVGSKPGDQALTPQRLTCTPPAADSGLSSAAAASSSSSPAAAVNLPSLADHESLTVRPPSTLPLLTAQASRTAPVSAPPALVPLTSAMGPSSGVVQSSDSEQHPPNTTPHAPKQSSSKSEHRGHGEDGKALAEEQNGKPEEHHPRPHRPQTKPSQKVEATETNKSEIRSPKLLTDLPGKPTQTTVAPNNTPTTSEKHHLQSSICEAEDSMAEQTPLRKSSHLHSTSREHLTDEEEESFNSSHTASHFDGDSTFDCPSRIDISSAFEKTSLLDGDSLCVDDSAHFDSSFLLRKDTSQFDSTSHAEEEPSTGFDTTGVSGYSLEDSRDDTLDSTREGEMSEADETEDSCQILSVHYSKQNVMKCGVNCIIALTPVVMMNSLNCSWRREIRVKKMENRMKGETWYYTPCGRRMKQFPEIIKYLKKHMDSVVSREHFSFSPRMPVGDFYEERETPEGKQWILLANEEVPSMIMAITGRRGRPPNPDKEKPRRVRALKGVQARRPGRPPKPKMIDLLSKVDAKLLKRLEAKEALTEEEKEKLVKIKKKMKKKARMKRREDTKIKKMKAEKKKAKAEPTDPTAPQVPQPAPGAAAVPKKPGRRRSVKVEAPPPVQQTDEERIAQGKRVLGARSKAKALAKAQAEAEAAAQVALTAKRAAERRAQTQRRMEERKRHQLIAEELKKPIEDMCLTDHKLLPELSRIPGVVLSGKAFAHCLAVVEFLHGYGKIIGLNIPKDVPSLATLQEGLLGLGDSQVEVQDLLIKLVEAALHDPGLPSFYQSVKILGDKLVETELTRSTVSEVLRVFLESHGYEIDVCNTLRTKTFHALPPDTKAAILGFLVDELNSSNVVTSDIDNTLENMATYRKNKWIIEGKLRKLKAALARRTGRSEEELCFEERRRSARVAEEENLSLEEGGLVSEKGTRRVRKEEPKLSDSESPTNASIPELERQIDKLAKRQAFFRKKLLQSSHSMRAVLLGQDRYQRRYLALPHLGGVLVEGPEELLTSGEVLLAEVPVTFLKKEPKLEEIPMPTTPSLPSSPSSAQPQTFSPDEDNLPGTASLMSRPRGRGRPRKIKPEVELHLRTAKIRRRRRSSVRSGGEEGPGSPNSGTHNLTQVAFQSWLNQSQDAVTDGTCTPAGDTPEGNRPEESVKEMAEKRGQWFNLIPKQPCDDSSLTECQIPSSPSKLLPSVLPALAAPLMQVSPPPPQLLPAPVPPTTPARPVRRRRRGSRGSSPARRGPRGAAAKRRGRPPNSVFQELEQQYFTQLVVKPIPTSMVRGWWWIQDPEELHSTLQALNPRGIREKVLHKHLSKHMESLVEICTKPINDPIFESKMEEKDVLREALQQPWQVQEKAMETDINALQWVEDLEQRVIAADLHLKAAPQSAANDAEPITETPMAEFQPYTIPDPDSTRDDLQYYEHEADPRDDWIVRTKKEWSNLPRAATHPVDLAVLRLGNLERNIERRYLKEPLWNIAEVMRLAPLTPTPGEEHPMDVFSLESEITSRLRTWRQALDRCRSAPQVCLCILQLEKAIAWERSVTKVTCQVCRKGDNDDCLLLCDGCDRGCHMYCLKPKITQVPEGDWFCPTCIAKDDCDSPRSSKKRTRVKKRRYEDESSEEETSTRRSSGGGGGMATRYKETVTPPSASRHSGEGSAAKRRRMTTRNQPDLTFCEIILMEMESHADAWPFLEPVNPRLVPGYRRIVKTPMDFLTMRERLLQGGYCSCEEFAADAHLVFNNCELFNEDTSEVGTAGHAMRRFFESRWAEFYSNRDK